MDNINSNVINAYTIHAISISAHKIGDNRFKLVIIIEPDDTEELGMYDADNNLFITNDEYMFVTND